MSKLIEFYVYEPRCPGCGKKTLKIDLSIRHSTLKRLCKCSGINWPHRKGTILDENQFCHSLPFDLVGARLADTHGIEFVRDLINDPAWPFTLVKPNNYCPF